MIGFGSVLKRESHILKRGAPIPERAAPRLKRGSFGRWFLGGIFVIN